MCFLRRFKAAMTNSRLSGFLFLLTIVSRVSLVNILMQLLVLKIGLFV
jgi:hypothetical protein